MNSRNLSRLVHGFALVGVFAWLYAGNLTPPAGPITSTMKTLVQVEPRTPIQSLSGSDEAVFVITEPGSYYLAGNVVGEAGKHGILIATDEDVTLDLMGFVLRGVEGSLSGVYLPDEIREQPQLVSLRNGVVKHWGEHGVFDHSEFQGPSWHIESLGVYENGMNGIYIMNGPATVKDCTADHNGAHGIEVRGTSTVENSKASWNGETGIWASLSSVSGCVVKRNQVGIVVSSGDVRACMAEGNIEIGIEARNGGQVADNTCRATKIGIRLLGSGFRVEGNLLNFCSTGIQTATSGKSLIARNTVISGPNGPSYDLSTSHTTGPIVQTRFGSRDLSNVENGSHPWANFDL